MSFFPEPVTNDDRIFSEQYLWWTGGTTDYNTNITLIFSSLQGNLKLLTLYHFIRIEHGFPMGGNRLCLGKFKWGGGGGGRGH